MDIAHFRKGDIIESSKTNHPIVFLRLENDEQFIGCLITHSPKEKYPDNIGLTKEHFIKNDENGSDYKVQYDDSYFVSNAILKENDWGPFYLTGRLTKEGICHIEGYLVDKPASWIAYIDKSKTTNM